MISLRPYQLQAVEKIIWAQSLPGNDLVILPTGSGKSIIISEIASRLDRDILILQPSKEILEQNYAKLLQYVPASEIGVYSASMNSKIIKKYTFATIGSIYKKPEYFSHFKLIIIDECHLVNPKNLDTMFIQFLNKIGNTKVIGLTATPYRLSTAYKPGNNYYSNGWVQITTIKLINRIKGIFWARIIFNTSIKEMMDGGYLVPIKYESKDFFNEEQLRMNISKSDYDLSSFESLLSSSEEEVLFCISGAMLKFKSTLIFCSSVEQATLFAGKIKGCEVVSAETPKKERIRIINGFKSENIPAVCNVGVLTTGFDHPGLDCIILVRPTQSIGLYVQMIGRGIRKSEGKEYCTVIDLAGNVRRMGKIETIEVTKIDNKWELISEKGSWHNKELYTHYVKK